MKYLAVIVAVSLVTVALFGFVLMTHDGGACNDAGMATTVNDCPTAIISMTLHHISAYTSFTGVFITLSTLLILAVLIVGVLGYTSRSLHLPAFSYAYINTHAHRRVSLVQRLKLIRWISLFEHSPSH